MADPEKYLSKNATLRSISSRRSVRNFLDKPVAEEDLEAILHAANHAPSAHNKQSWRFIVLKGQRKSELVDFITLKANEFPRPAYVLLRMASRSIASAPVVIAVANSGELISQRVRIIQSGQKYRP